MKASTLEEMIQGYKKLKEEKEESMELIERAFVCYSKLQEIAHKPGLTAASDYIDVLIEKDKKRGFDRKSKTTTRVKDKNENVGRDSRQKGRRRKETVGVFQEATSLR